MSRNKKFLDIKQKYDVIELAFYNHSEKSHINVCFFFSIIFNIPRFFELRTVMNPKNTTIFNETIEQNVTSEVLMPEVEPTEIRKDSAYSRDYVLIANSVALGFIPIIALIVLNSFIFRTINKATQRHNAISSNQRRDHSVSYILYTLLKNFFILRTRCVN